jgi:hypothetical protein
MDMFGDSPYIVVLVDECSDPVSWLVAERGNVVSLRRVLMGTPRGRFRA